MRELIDFISPVFYPLNLVRGYKKSPVSWNEIRGWYFKNIYFPDTFGWGATFAELTIPRDTQSGKNMLNTTKNNKNSKHKL